MWRFDSKKFTRERVCVAIVAVVLAFLVTWVIFDGVGQLMQMGDALGHIMKVIWVKVIPAS